MKGKMEKKGMQGRKKGGEREGEKNWGRKSVSQWGSNPQPFTLKVESRIYHYISIANLHFDDLRCARVHALLCQLPAFSYC